MNEGFISGEHLLAYRNGMKLLSRPQENVMIEKPDSTTSGPYLSHFLKNNICIDCAQADIQAGDVIIRRLQNGRDERSVVTNWSFYPEKTTTFENKKVTTTPAHYQVEFTKEDVLKMQQKIQPASFNINNSQVQIGDHNTQNIINAIQDLQNKIDASAATPEEKAEAKGWLAKALSHPLITSILGGLSGGLVG